MTTEFRVLGEVGLRVAGHRVELGHARQRGVLAALLLDAGRTVPTDRIVDRIWGERPPARARETVYSYLSRLRRVLGDVPDVALLRRGGGYVLDVDPDAVDLHRFRDLAARARDTAIDSAIDTAIDTAIDSEAGTERVTALFDRALALWRGPALSGLEGEWFAGLRDELERERFAVELDRTDARLAGGGHAEVLAGLLARAEEHPLDERVAGQLMRALHRSGRRADATRHFHRTRSRLVDELGLEPGAALHRLHQEILTGAPDPDAGRAGRTGHAGPEYVAPEQLPAEATGFVGRADELTELTDALGAAPGPHGDEHGQHGEITENTAVRISLISGTAGAGKTALALRAAHRLRADFPDGRLYVNLRGYDPDEPLPATEALVGFLRALGVPGPQIPARPDELAAAFRSRVAGRRLLVVLDNAGSAEHVRPLLPGTPSVAVLVTSRDSLVGLVAREGARRVALDRLPSADALRLVESLVGRRAREDHGAVAVLVERCARLPLALRIAAELAVARPSVPLATLVTELADEQRRLELLDAAGDPRTAVQAVFSWSHRYLPDDAARAFRLLGLHPGPDVDPYAVAALTEEDPGRARELLDRLARGHLVRESGPDRYEMHDLLRAYAARRAAAVHTADERRSAGTRLLDHYLHAAGHAMDVLVSAENARRPSLGPATTPLPPLDDPAAARAWLDTERATLTTACVYAATHGWPGHASDLAGVVARYFELGGHYAEAVALHTHARDAARRTGDRAGEARALDNLGLVHRWQDRYPEAAEHHRRAAALFGEIGDRPAEAYALSNAGVVAWQQGDLDSAAEQQLRALALFREIGDRTGRARIVTTLGFVRRRQGRFREAAGHHREALALFTELDDPFGESYTLAGLGLVLGRTGQLDEALEHHRRSLELFRGNGDRAGEAYALGNLGIVACDRGELEHAASLLGRALDLARTIGDQATQAYGLDDLGVVHRRRGDLTSALSHHRRSILWCREIGERPGEAKARNNLGETRYEAGDHDTARDEHSAALALATTIGDRYERAKAHHGLARCHRAARDREAAARHAREALDRYVEMGVPEAETLAAELERLDERARG